MKHISESIIGRKGLSNVSTIADTFLKFFGKYIKKPSSFEIDGWINVDKSHYTGQDFQYDFVFIDNDIGLYRRISAKFAEAIHGSIRKESSGFGGSFWYWDPETIIDISSIGKIHIGRRIGDRKYPKSTSNTTYASLTNKDLWMAIYEKL